MDPRVRMKCLPDSYPKLIFWTPMDQSKCRDILRDNNLSLDVVIKITEKLPDVSGVGERKVHTFKADKAVLMSKMEFFEKMFLYNIREKDATDILLNPEEVPADIFEKILSYANDPNIDLAGLDLLELYIAADFLRFEELIDRIQKFRSITVQDILRFKEFAINGDMKSLQKACHKWIIKNLCCFIDIYYRTQLIPLLSFEELIDVLEKLQILSREEDLFYYVMDWLSDQDKSNPLESSRGLEFFELNDEKKIPWEAMSKKFLKKAVSKCGLRLDANGRLLECVTEEERNNYICCVVDLYKKRQIEDQSNFLQTSGQLTPPFWRGLTRFFQRQSPQARNPNPIGMKNSESFKLSEWVKTTPMPSRIYAFSCVTVGHKIYVCGGRDENGIRKELIVLDTQNPTKWKQLKPMKHAMGFCDAAVLNGHIYVVGVANGMTVVERYCIASDWWEDVASMTTERAELELVALNGFLYVIGKKYGARWKTAERYDPHNDQWTTKFDMPNEVRILMF